MRQVELALRLQIISPKSDSVLVWELISPPVKMCRHTMGSEREDVLASLLQNIADALTVFPEVLYCVKTYCEQIGG